MSFFVMNGSQKSNPFYAMACFAQVCTAKMNLSDEVDLEDYVSRPDKISAAEVS